jgi:MFS family permease
VSNRQTLITLCLASFLGSVSFSVLLPVLPYYSQEMGASPSQVGLIIALYSYVTAVFLIPFGMLADKIGARRMLIAGLLLYTLTPLLYHPTNNLIQLGFVRAAHGLASSVFLPAASALTIQSVPSERWGEALGWLTMAMQSSLVIGPVLGGLLLNRWGFHAAFYSCSIIPLAGLFFVLLRLRTVRSVSAELRVRGSFTWLKQPGVFTGLITPLFFTIGSGTIFTFMPLHGQALGISETMAGIIIATLYLGSTLLRVPGGKLSDKIGRKPVILLGLALASATMLLISFTGSAPVLITLAIFFGMGMGLAMPAAYALVADLTPSEMMGLSMGMTSSFLYCGLALGPTIMGVVAAMSNYPTMFRVCSLSLLLGIIVILSLIGKRRRTQT